MVCTAAAQTMDLITFQHDTVLSDVHVFIPSARHLMTRLNGVGQPVFMSTFRILALRDGAEPGTPGEAGGGVRADPALDEDGDLDVTHRPRPNPDRNEDDDDDDTRSSDVIRIEHTMATPLEDVGKQVWRGAFLLADFILSDPAMFAGATVLELGAGTGLTSIVMATMARTVYCTDVGEDLLSMCRRNVTLNRHVTAGEVKVRHLDWLEQDLRTDLDLDFSWRQEEVTELYDTTSVIVAADVFYDDDLTDALFRTLLRLCGSFERSCSVFFSIERRVNFTLRDLHASCDVYDHFRRCVSRLQGVRDGACGFTVQRLPADFPQALSYERVEQLELAAREPIGSVAALI
uniref:Uncharacterized protein n=1 Tax=Mola mola TaxID=94237 RepID=A0A3Q3WZG7_MOLML